MTGPFELRPADLHAHAGHVREVADDVDLASAAGRAVRAAPGAYGQLCAIVPVMLGALQDVLVDEIADSAEDLRRTAGLVRAAADGYERTDEANAGAISRTREGL